MRLKKHIWVIKSRNILSRFWNTIDRKFFFAQLNFCFVVFWLLQLNGVLNWLLTVDCSNWQKMDFSTKQFIISFGSSCPSFDLCHQKKQTITMMVKVLWYQTKANMNEFTCFYTFCSSQSMDPERLIWAIGW